MLEKAANMEQRVHLIFGQSIINADSATKQILKV
jgi:hypothetical protein